MLLVDYGNEVSVGLNYCRRLPPEFHDIPSFAIRAHIDIEFLVPGGGKSQTWSSHACRIFMNTSGEKEPTYFFFRSYHGKVINLTELAQDFVYNHRKNMWEAGSESDIEVDKVINEERKHPMLSSLFRSIRVEIYYEVMIPAQPVWFFANVMHILVKNGYAKYLQCPISKDKLHLAIVEMMNEAAAPWLKFLASSSQVNTPVTEGCEAGGDTEKAGSSQGTDVTVKSILLTVIPEETPSVENEICEKIVSIILQEPEPAPEEIDPARLPPPGEPSVKDEDDDLESGWDLDD